MLELGITALLVLTVLSLVLDALQLSLGVEPSLELLWLVVLVLASPDLMLLVVFLLRLAALLGLDLNETTHVDIMLLYR